MSFVKWLSEILDEFEILLSDFEALYLLFYIGTFKNLWNNQIWWLLAINVSKIVLESGTFFHVMPWRKIDFVKKKPLSGKETMGFLS